MPAIWFTLLPGLLNSSRDLLFVSCLRLDFWFLLKSSFSFTSGDLLHLGGIVVLLEVGASYSVTFHLEWLLGLVQDKKKCTLLPDVETFLVFIFLAHNPPIQPQSVSSIIFISLHHYLGTLPK